MSTTIELKLLEHDKLSKDTLLPKKEFLKIYRITEKQFSETKIQWSELEKIYDNYSGHKNALENFAKEITNKFLTNEAKEAGVHSVRYRIKKSESLIEKIIRKKIEKKRNKTITVKNYLKEVTDLIGIRILHAFKADWLDIHDFINKHYSKDFKEKPKVYYRKGDAREFINQCKKHGCKTEPHKKGYRSIHYIIEPHPAKPQGFAEVQVRTVFEDGWSEIDHKMRYIQKKNKKHPLDQYLLTLNRIAGSADEIGSIIRNRKVELEIEEHEKRILNLTYSKKKK